MSTLECVLLGFLITLVLLWIYERWPGKGDF